MCLVLLCLIPLLTESASPIEKGGTPEFPITGTDSPLLVIDSNDKTLPTIDLSISLILPAQIAPIPGEETTPPATCRSCH